MNELEEYVKIARDLQDKLNEALKNLDGQGCDIKIHVSVPYDKIDFITITKTIEFKEL